MGRKTKHSCITDIVQYYISRYYQLLERENNSATQAVKLSTANAVDIEYMEELERHYPAWNTQEAQQHFKAGIDMLTQVYTVERSALALVAEKEAFRNKLLNKLWNKY